MTSIEMAYRGMMVALVTVIEANEEFCKGMPDNWEGDPMQEACETAKKALDFAKANLATAL